MRVGGGLAAALFAIWLVVMVAGGGAWPIHLLLLGAIGTLLVGLWAEHEPGG